MLLELALAAGALALARRRRGAGGGLDLKTWTPNSAERNGWVQMHDGAGLVVRSQNHAWTTPAVIRVVQQIGLAAQDEGGAFWVADVGQKKRGVPFPPHVSHMWGNDLDAGYTLDQYPTPADVPVDPRIIQILAAALPWIDRVGVNEARRVAFAGAPFKVETWKGHVGHLHLRLKSELTARPRMMFRRAAPEVEAEFED